MIISLALQSVGNKIIKKIGETELEKINSSIYLTSDIDQGQYFKDKNTAAAADGGWRTGIFSKVSLF